ncbi:MAG: hypothetical protein R2807_02720 [Chitinophagales bacterium]
MKKNKITVYNGHGSFINKNTISIKKVDGTEEQIETSKTIIATGSKTINFALLPIDKQESSLLQKHCPLKNYLSQW